MKIRGKDETVGGIGRNLCKCKSDVCRIFELKCRFK